MHAINNTTKYTNIQHFPSDKKVENNFQLQKSTETNEATNCLITKQSNYFALSCSILSV